MQRLLRLWEKRVFARGLACAWDCAVHPYLHLRILSTSCSYLQIKLVLPPPGAAPIRSNSALFPIITATAHGKCRAWLFYSPWLF